MIRSLFREWQHVVAFWACFVAIMFNPALIMPVKACPCDSLLLKIQQDIPKNFDDPEIGIFSKSANLAAKNTWQTIILQGYALEKGQTDKIARTTFGQIQAHMERSMVAAMEPGTTALWIIHAPLIATPLVTKGDLTENLAHLDIAKDKDSTRLHTALGRAKIIREFLAKGGVIITAYEKGEAGRTSEQLAIFNELKKRYPNQLIEFPIFKKYFPDGHYPLNKTGATYFFQEKNGNILEITNLGVQLTQTPEASWGVWWQDKYRPNRIVTQRLCEIMSFLSSAGLDVILQQHAIEHQMDMTPYLNLFIRYRPHGSTTTRDTSICVSNL